MSAADAEPLPSFADLPEAALACILEHVPLRQRLSRCALVCRCSAAAATSVPADVDVELVSQDKCEQLSAWLEVRGQQVVSLTAAGKSKTTLQLPCHNLSRLRSLRLTRLKCHLMLLQVGAVTRSRSRAAAAGGDVSSTAAGSGAAGAAALLPQLRELRLSYACMSRHHLLQLSALSRLSQLHLAGIQLYHSKTEQRLTDAEQAAAVTQLLPHLTGLSDLSVRWCDALTPAQLVEPISTMQRLQRLELSLDSSSGSEPLLAALPVSLTALVVTGLPSVTAAAELSRLTNLQQLSTQLVAIQPAILAGLTWLRHLRLLSPYTRYQAPISAPALLAALGRLTQLQHLELHGCWLGEAQQQAQQQEEEDGCQCFSALTASTQLTALQLQGFECVLLPSPAALDTMFPSGRVLPHLAVLRLSVNWHIQPTAAAPHACVGAEQLARIAASCPALRQLVLENVTPPDFDTSCLDQLPPGVVSVEGIDWQRPAAV